MPELSTLSDSAASRSPGHESTARRPLIAGTIAAVAGSLCCVAPVVLLLLGIGGAWISYLTMLTPYRPIFIGVTLVFLALAFRKLYLVAPACAPDGTCVTPRSLRNQRMVFWTVTVILLTLLAFPWYTPLLLA